MLPFTNMADLKREYVVPLRRKTRFAPKWRRSKKAVSVLKEFISKHMKTDNVIVCNDLNMHLWENGSRNPPGKVSVIALKTKINNVELTLVNLLEKGLDEQLKLYQGPATAPVSEVKADSSSKEVVKDAEVKEVVEEEKKVTEEKPKKESKKKEENKK